MNSEEYSSYDAFGLAELVAGGDVKPSELLDAALARLSQVNPTLNAVVRTFEPAAREAVGDGLAHGPFAGVPFLIKDITLQVRGEPTTAGSRMFANAVAERDSALVAAYRRAGFVFFGKTNTPEFALLGITEPDLFGATLNPWNLERTCGGSSGGSASAVAAGIVPAASASDGGGSIRIPAACCGLFGMKPSRGRVSMAPQGEGWGGLTCLHALTRTVRDSAAILDLSCGPQPGDVYWRERPLTPFASEAKRDPGCLRIGMLPTNLQGGPIDDEIAAAVAEAGRLCESMGHIVEEVKPPVDLSALMPAALTVIATSVVNTVDAEVERRGTPLRDGEIEPVSRMLYENGKSSSARDYLRAVQAMHRISRLAAPFFETYDVMLLSTLGRLPISVGLLRDGNVDFGSLVAKFADYGPNTQLFNVTGQPAMSMPLAWSADGTPIGIQFAGRAGDEATLFRLAGQLETARPWIARRPPELQ
jgi:amidase